MKLLLTLFFAAAISLFAYTGYQDGARYNDGYNNGYDNGPYYNNYRGGYRGHHGNCGHW